MDLDIVNTLRECPMMYLKDIFKERYVKCRICKKIWIPKTKKSGVCVNCKEDCMMCKTCGFEWKPRVEKPVSCPRCKRRFDYVRIRIRPFKCSRCGYEWKGYKPNPKTCPKCAFRLGRKV